MKSISEIYVPGDWYKTTIENPSYPSRNSDPIIEPVEDNFNLSIITNYDIRDDLLDCDEEFVVTLTHENNEIQLIEKTNCYPKQDVDCLINDVDFGGVEKDFSYVLKVIDHKTKSTMYFDVKLARVEIAEKKEPQQIPDENINEHLEVIAKLDDDDTFETEFGDPVDWEGDKK